MAVQLLGVDNGYVNLGDLADIAGTTLTFAFTILPDSGGLVGSRFFTQWAPSNAEQAIIALLTDVNNIGVAFGEGGGQSLWGVKTDDAPVAAGGMSRVIVTVETTAPTIEIWVDGVKRSTVAWFTGTARAIADSTKFLTLGYEIATTNDGVDGVYSEVALWDEVVPDWVCEAYGRGFSASFYRTNGILYCPVYNNVYLVDEWNGNPISQAGSSTAPSHPPMIYPAPLVAYEPSAAPPGTAFDETGREITLLVGTVQADTYLAGETDLDITLLVDVVGTDAQDMVETALDVDLLIAVAGTDTPVGGDIDETDRQVTLLMGVVGTDTKTLVETSLDADFLIVTSETDTALTLEAGLAVTLLVGVTGTDIQTLVETSLDVDLLVVTTETDTALSLETARVVTLLVTVAGADSGAKNELALGVDLLIGTAGTDTQTLVETALDVDLLVATTGSDDLVVLETGRDVTLLVGVTGTDGAVVMEPASEVTLLVGVTGSDASVAAEMGLDVDLLLGVTGSDVLTMAEMERDVDLLIGVVGSDAVIVEEVGRDVDLLIVVTGSDVPLGLETVLVMLVSAGETSYRDGATGITWVQYKTAIAGLDPAEYGNDDWYLEVTLETEDAALPVSARLYNLTSLAAVVGSVASVSSEIPTFARSSSFDLASGENEYVIEYGGPDGGRVHCLSASLKHVPA